MKRRVFLTKGVAGVFTLGAVGCSKNDSINPLSSSVNAVISGMIADPGGNGVQGVSITAAGNGVSRFAVTDEAGNYAIEVPQKGEYTIYPNKNGYKFNPISQKITVNNSQSFVVNIMALMVNTKSSDIETTELGTTGIMVSKFGFGSHVLSEHRNNKSLREYMIRTAYDYGVTTFDVYNDHTKYEDVGKYLAPVINDVVLSINQRMVNKNTTIGEVVDYALNAFNRDTIDMVRMGWGINENYWAELFDYREQGKVRAVGVATHDPDTQSIQELIDTYPFDFVLMPYNFYHNIGWPPDLIPVDFTPLAQTLREKGIGIATMKPFAGDYFIDTLKEEAANINPELSFTQAALRYVLNSGLEPDTSFTGMNLFNEFLENVQAYYEPEISDDEYTLLDEVKAVAEKKAHAVLPDHYRFLDKWAPKTSNDTEVEFA